MLRYCSAMSCFISASTICAINSLRRCSASVESLASRSARAFTLVPSSQNRPCQHAARQCDALQAPRFRLRRPQNQTSSSSRNARSAGSSGASNGSSASTNAGVVGTACVGRSAIPASSTHGPEGGQPLRQYPPFCAGFARVVMSRMTEACCAGGDVEDHPRQVMSRMILDNITSRG